MPLSLTPLSALPPEAAGICAVLLSWLCGIIWISRLMPSRGSPAAGLLALWLGYGYPAGLLATSWLLLLADLLGQPLRFAPVATALALLGALGVAPALADRYRRGRRHGRRREHGRDRGRRDAAAEISVAAPVAAPVRVRTRCRAPDPVPCRWQQVLWTLLLTLLLLRLLTLALEIGLRPVFPWDAWTTWTLRARVWFERGDLTPFVDAGVWLRDGGTALYTIEAWNYPRTVSLISLWPALAGGTWNPAVVNLPWLGCAVALGLGFYGQARRCGATPLTALLPCYLLLSLPLLNAHVALAGYADLWLATCYGFAAFAYFGWLREGCSRQGWLALLFALACPLLKREGALWLLTLLPSLLLIRLPRRAGPAVLAGGAGLFLFWLWRDGLRLNLPGLGEIVLTPDEIALPRLGRFELHYESAWRALADSFLRLDSWHLFWYVMPLLLLLALPRARRDRLLAHALTVLGSGLAMLYVLFFFTDAQRWAEQFTSLNRLFLQPAPALLFFALLLYLRGRPDTPDTARPAGRPPG